MSEFTEYERALAIQEALMIHAENEYFQARPQLESDHNRRIFDSGFERGYMVIEHKLAEANKRAEQAEQRIEESQRQEPVGLFASYEFEGQTHYLEANDYELSIRAFEPLYRSPIIPPTAKADKVLTTTKSDVEAYLAERDEKVLEDFADELEQRLKTSELIPAVKAQITIFIGGLRRRAAERKKKGE